MGATNDNLIQQLLAQRLANPQQQAQQMPGANQAGPQMQPQMNPMSTAGQIAQKLMLMRALQQRPPGVAQPTPQTPAGGTQLGWPQTPQQTPGLPQP